MKNGFTLIELLAVLILISILIVVSFVSFGYLTKQKENEVLEMKIKTFHSSLDNYMDKKGNIYTEKTRYIYCITVDDFIDDSTYKAKDFFDMYDLTNITDKVIKVNFDNANNFTIKVVNTSDCSQGPRADNVGIVKSFGNQYDDMIDDMIPFKDGYAIVGRKTKIINLGAKDISDSKPVLTQVSLGGATNYFVATVDKDFNIIEEKVLGESGKFISIVDSKDGNFNVLVQLFDDNNNARVIKMDSELYEISNTSFLIPWSSTVDKLVKLTDGFYLSGEFDQRSRPEYAALPYGKDKLIMKINYSGIVLWSLAFGSNGSDGYQSYLTIDNEENIYYGTTIASQTRDFVSFIATNYSSSLMPVSNIKKDDSLAVMSTFPSGVLIKITNSGSISWIKGLGKEITSVNYFANQINVSSFPSSAVGGYNYNISNKAATINSINMPGTFIRKTIFFEGATYLLVSSNSNTGIFAGKNPSLIYKNYLLKTTDHINFVVRELPEVVYSEDAHLVSDKNGLLLITKNNTTTIDDLYIRRIDKNTLNFIETKITSTGISNSRFFKFENESILTFTSEQNTNDLVSFPSNGNDDTIIIRLKW